MGTLLWKELSSKQEKQEYFLLNVHMIRKVLYFQQEYFHFGRFIYNFTSLGYKNKT